jgi:hypothetical protein
LKFRKSFGIVSVTGQSGEKSVGGVRAKQRAVTGTLTMDIRHMRYFVGVADAGSMIKASERLHVAQPSLSVHITNLEIELGVKLMQRSNRGAVDKQALCSP